MFKKKERDFASEIRELEEKLADLKQEAAASMNREAWKLTRESQRKQNPAHMYESLREAVFEDGGDHE